MYSSLLTPSDSFSIRMFLLYLWLRYKSVCRRVNINVCHIFFFLKAVLVEIRLLRVAQLFIILARALHHQIISFGSVCCVIFELTRVGIVLIILQKLMTSGTSPAAESFELSFYVQIFHLRSKNINHRANKF